MADLNQNFFEKPMTRKDVLQWIAGLSSIPLVGGFGAGYGLFRPEKDHLKTIQDLENTRARLDDITTKLDATTTERDKLRRQVKAFEDGNMDPAVLSDIVWKETHYDFRPFFEKNPLAESYYPHLIAANEEFKGEITWVNPLLQMLIIKKESLNGRLEISKVGAYGPPQLMPQTAQWPDLAAYADTKEQMDAAIRKAKWEGHRPFMDVFRGPHFDTAWDAYVKREDARGRMTEQQENIVKFAYRYRKSTNPPDADKLKEILESEHRSGLEEWQNITHLYMQAAIERSYWNEVLSGEQHEYVRLLEKVREEPDKYLRSQMDERSDVRFWSRAQTIYLGHLTLRFQGNLYQVLNHYNGGNPEAEFDETILYRNIITEWLMDWHKTLPVLGEKEWEREKGRCLDLVEKAS